MKKCITCEIEKEEAEFSKAISNKDRFTGACKSCLKEYKKYNKEKIKEYNKEYKKANKEKIKEYNKEHYKANKEKRKEQIKEYNKTNKERRNKLRRERKKIDPLFKLSSNLRNRNWFAFKSKGYKKNTKTQEMLGVNWEVCKSHIERQFTKGMTWDNQGEWHIDHIIPLASANTKQELKKLCHYSNLQPLWAVDNIIKSAKINGQQNRFRF